MHGSMNIKFLWIHLFRLKISQSTSVTYSVFKGENRPSVVHCIRHSISASGGGVIEKVLFGSKIRNITYYPTHIFYILLQSRKTFHNEHLQNTFNHV